MDGSFSVSLTRNGEEDTTIALAIRRPIRLEGAKADGTEFAFSTAAKNPLFGLRAQGIERRLSVDLDIGVTTINIPWNEFVEESVATAMADIDWKGLSGSVVLEDGMSNLVFSNLGFGDGQSTIKYDGQTVFALDLNKQTGRRADVTITPADPALPQFEISPELDLEMRWYLQPLADLGDEIESYLLDDSYRIKFGGSQPTIQPVAGSIETDSGALKVVSGNLTISATGTAAIVVDAGECLRGDDAVTPGEHEILGQLTVATCP